MFNRLKELLFIWAVASPHIILIYFFMNDYEIENYDLLVAGILLFAQTILLFYYLHKKYYLE